MRGKWRGVCISWVGLSQQGLGAMSEKEGGGDGRAGSQTE